MLGIYLNNFETKFSSLHTIKKRAPLLIRREKFCFPKFKHNLIFKIQINQSHVDKSFVYKFHMSNPFWIAC